MNMCLTELRFWECNFLQVFATKEELNLHFGIHLWGKQTGRKSVQQLGATMRLGGNDGVRRLGSLFFPSASFLLRLAMATATIQEFFLMTEGSSDLCFLGSL